MLLINKRVGSGAMAGLGHEEILTELMPAICYGGRNGCSANNGPAPRSPFDVDPQEWCLVVNRTLSDKLRTIRICSYAVEKA